MMMHGFSKVKAFGSGRASRYFGYRFPLAMYGSYLLVGTKA
jgi:hypothetical protein